MASLILQLGAQHASSQVDRHGISATHLGSLAHQEDLHLSQNSSRGPTIPMEDSGLLSWCSHALAVAAPTRLCNTEENCTAKKPKNKNKNKKPCKGSWRSQLVFPTASLSAVVHSAFSALPQCSEHCFLQDGVLLCTPLAVYFHVFLNKLQRPAPSLKQLQWLNSISDKDSLLCVYFLFPPETRGKFGFRQATKGTQNTNVRLGLYSSQRCVQWFYSDWYCDVGPY